MKKHGFYEKEEYVNDDSINNAGIHRDVAFVRWAICSREDTSQGVLKSLRNAWAATDELVRKCESAYNLLGSNWASLIRITYQTPFLLDCLQKIKLDIDSRCFDNAEHKEVAMCLYQILLHDLRHILKKDFNRSALDKMAVSTEHKLDLYTTDDCTNAGIHCDVASVRWALRTQMYDILACLCAACEAASILALKCALAKRDLGNRWFIRMNLTAQAPFLSNSLAYAKGVIDDGFPNDSKHKDVAIDLYDSLLVLLLPITNGAQDVVLASTR